MENNLKLFIWQTENLEGVYDAIALADCLENAKTILLQRIFEKEENYNYWYVFKGENIDREKAYENEEFSKRMNTTMINYLHVVNDDNIIKVIDEPYAEYCWY